MSSRMLTGLVLVCSIFFSIFLFQNKEDLAFSWKKLSSIFSGKPLQKLVIKDSTGITIASFPLPTSDLFDRTGDRQINFQYLQKKELIQLAAMMKKARFFMNGDVVHPDVVRLHESALSIAFRRKKLYLLAPPYTEMAIRALKFERKNRQDVFKCEGGDEFCRAVKVVGFGGISDIIERTLQEDTHYGEEPFPRGRWVSRFMGIALSSTRKQRVNVRYVMRTPIIAQGVHIKRPANARLKMLRHGELGGLKISGVSLGDFIFDVQLELNAGNNVIELLFDIVTEKTVDVPMAMSGILTEIKVIPIPSMP